MRFPRKLAYVLAGVLVAVLLLLVTIPMLFGDRLERAVQAQIDSSVAARVHWDDVGLSLVRDFPNATLVIDGLSVVGVAPFAGDTLLTLRRAGLVLDLGSVLGNLRRGAPIVVRELSLDAPDARLRVLADGRANWDIARTKGSDATGASSMSVTLRDLSIRDGRLTLDDRQSQLTASIAGLEETLRGDFAQQRFALASRTRADSVSVRFAGVPYLSRARVDFDAALDADLPAKRFTFSRASLKLNALALALAGSITTGDPDLGLDLRFAAPSTEFAGLLSLVPAVYRHDFAELQTKGRVAVAGQVRGKYGPTSFPALAVRARVEDGAFRYPGLPLPARDIAMELAIDNAGGSVDNTVVDLRRFHAVIGRRPIDAHLVMRTPVSDPDVNMRLVGAVDLADLARTVKLEGMQELAGRVAANVAVRARLSDVDAGRYERVDASGTVHVGRLAMRGTTLPHAVAVDTAALHLTPRTAQLTALSAKVGSSDVRATGSLDNLLGFLLRDQDLRGRATVASRNVNLDEWRSDEALSVVPVPPRVDFALDAAAERVTYGALTVANVRGGVHIKDQRATLRDLRMEMLRGGVVASGFYETVVPDKPAFDVDLRLATLDIPAAFATLTTVQKLAPVARWAQGTVSGTIGLRGALGPDMLPVFPALTGKGAIEADGLVIKDAPVLGKLADALSLERVRNPSLGAVRAAFDIIDGRLHVKPFDVAMNGIGATVSGSHGFDQSLAYELAMAVPRAVAGPAMTRLASAARRAGAELDSGAVVNVGALLTGTVGEPTVKPSFAGAAASIRGAATQVVQAGVATGTAAVREQADSAADAARRRAREEADRVLAEAERQAETMRAEARVLAAKVRSEAAVRADSLTARASNPAARIAAGAAADRLRSEGDRQAERIIREADTRAEGIVAQARQRANALAPAPTPNAAP